MKLNVKEHPREFNASGITIKDYGKIELNENDMITLITESGKECDITAKEWGFYLAPSINARLRQNGFKVALVRNQEGKLFINAVEIDKTVQFIEYLSANQDSRILCWLDDWPSQ